MCSLELLYYAMLQTNTTHMRYYCVLYVFIRVVCWVKKKVKKKKQYYKVKNNKTKFQSSESRNSHAFKYR